jgi:hypothetical protein
MTRFGIPMLYLKRNNYAEYACLEEIPYLSHEKVLTLKLNKKG